MPGYKNCGGRTRGTREMSLAIFCLASRYEMLRNDGALFPHACLFRMPRQFSYGGTFANVHAVSKTKSRKETRPALCEKRILTLMHCCCCGRGLKSLLLSVRGGHDLFLISALKSGAAGQSSSLSRLNVVAAAATPKVASGIFGSSTGN